MKLVLKYSITTLLCPPLSAQIQLFKSSLLFHHSTSNLLSLLSHLYVSHLLPLPLHFKMNFIELKK